MTIQTLSNTELIGQRHSFDGQPKSIERLGSPFMPNSAPFDGYHKVVSTKSSQFTFIDLFAGVGGFHAAGSGFGGDCVYAVEKDPTAARIYEINWGTAALGDITADANEDQVIVPSHDLLFAGFPCQPFSKSGAQRGMDEARGTLFWNIARIIEVRRPSVVILENVRNLAGPRHEHEWSTIIETLRSLGYRVSEKPAVLSPHKLPRHLGGRPQIRERVFITATFVGPGQYAISDAVDPVTLEINVQGWKPSDWDLERDLPLDENNDEKLKLSDQEIHWVNAWDEFVKRYLAANDGRSLPGFPIWADAWRGASSQTDSQMPAWKADFLLKNQTLYAANSEWIDLWAEKWGIFTSVFPPSRRKFEWQAQDATSLWDAVMHFRPSGIRAKKATYLPALVAITQTSIIGPLRRRLAPKEAARLQGLPDWYSFEGQSDAATYKQMGNGVNVGVVWQIVKAHIKRDRQYIIERSPGLVAAVEAAPDSPDTALARISR